MTNLKSLIIIVTFLAATFTAISQVKIGDNPSTIDQNSLLELESETKGLLAPRVTLIHTDSVNPLTAPVPEGMLVYNDGDSIDTGFYVWNGSSWLEIRTSAGTRDNYVLVKSVEDFPEPDNGIITLDSNSVYEINGTITLTDQINLNGCVIKGVDRFHDKLIYTSTSGALFTGCSGTLHDFTLSATGSGAKVFDLNGQNDPTQTLLLEDLFIFDSDNIGEIKNFPGYVVFQSIAFSNNGNGITLQNIGSYLELDNYWLENNQNTYQTFLDTFIDIQIIGGKRHVLSAFSATALDISGIDAIEDGGELKTTFFLGDGTLVNGSFSNEWEVECHGLDTEKDQVAGGNLYISSSTTTSISSANTPVKIDGTTTAVNLYRFTSSADNRLKYDGTKTRYFMVSCAMTMTSGWDNNYYSIYIAKNGTVLPESKQTRMLSWGADQGILVTMCSVQLAPGDYIEAWIENNSDSDDMTAQTMNLTIR